MSNRQKPKPRPITLRQPAAADSEPPKGMTPAATDKWRETYTILVGLGIATEADRDALRLYCQTWASWARVRDVLDREGETYRSRKGVVARPEVRIERAHRDTLVRIMDRLGLTPVGRRRLKLRPITPGGSSLAAFVARRGGPKLDA